MEEKIQEALKRGPRTNRELRAALGLKGVADAKLDRTLQRMRKDGRIKAVSGRWLDASIAVCHHCDGKGWLQGK